MTLFETKTELDVTPQGEPLVLFFYRRRGEARWRTVGIVLRKGQTPDVVEDFADEIAARLLEGRAA